MTEPATLKTCSHHPDFFPNEPADRPVSEFGPNKQSNDGLRYECRRCFNAKQNATRAAKRQEIATAAPPADPLKVALESHREARERRDLKAEHRALLEENERLHARIGQLVTMTKPPEILVYKQARHVRADAVACAAASDWHIEETVDRAAVHGLNEYSLEIARVRARIYFQNVLKLALMMARDSKINTLYLAILGDFFSGWIHKELLAACSLAPGDAAREWIGIFASGIDFLLRESSFVLEADLIPGNHGRMTDQIHFSDPTGTSLETFAYHALALRYQGNPRVRFKVADHAMVYRKFFERFMQRAIHGYEVKYGGGVGGITIPLNKAIAQWDIAVRADLTIAGHFHQFFDGNSFLLNGSLIGYNTYAQAIKAKYEEARQAFWLIHASNGGRKAGTFPVWVDK